MMAIWTNGKDYVLARDAKRIPEIMDLRYGVSGHSLGKHWRKVDPDDIVPIISNELERILLIPAHKLSELTQEMWLGSFNSY